MEFRAGTSSIQHCQPWKILWLFFGAFTGPETSKRYYLEHSEDYWCFDRPLQYPLNSPDKRSISTWIFTSRLWQVTVFSTVAQVFLCRVFLYRGSTVHNAVGWHEDLQGWIMQSRLANLQAFEKEDSSTTHRIVISLIMMISFLLGDVLSLIVLYTITALSRMKTHPSKSPD